MPFSNVQAEQYIKTGLPGDPPASARLTVHQDRKGIPATTLTWKGLPWQLDDDQEFSIKTDPGSFPVVEIGSCHAQAVSWDSTTQLGEVRLATGRVSITYRTPDAGSGGRGVVVCYLTGVNVLSNGTKAHALTGTNAAWQLALLEPTIETQNALRTFGSGYCTATLAAPVTDVSASMAALESEAAEIAWLLGFALGRKVGVCRVDLRSEDGWLLRTVATAVQGGVLGVDGPLPFDDIRYRGGVPAYVAHGLAAMRTRDTAYRLKAAMHISALARTVPVAEVMALLTSNLLEVLRFNFGHNVLVASGRAVANGDDICFVPGVNKGRRMYFAEILDALCQEHGIAGWSKDFVDLRNGIVHQGEILGSTHQERIENVLDAIHFTDRVLLALLDCDPANLQYFRVNSADFAQFQKGVI